jgi:hypothetical protein
MSGGKCRFYFDDVRKAFSFETLTAIHIAI